MKEAQQSLDLMALKKELAGKSKAERFRYLKGIHTSSGLTKKPRKLKIDEILTLPDEFQPRDTGSDILRSESHIAALVRALKTGEDLDPILVLPLGGSFVCLDGHHRLIAYERAGITKGIPISVFEGEFRDAWTQPIESNVKDKLPMTEAEKLEAAWVMLLTGEYTWDEIAERAKASRSTVARMSKAKRQLEEEGLDISLHTWAQAKEIINGQKAAHDDSWVDKETRDIGRRLAKEFGPDLGKRPALFGGGIYHYSPTTSPFAPGRSRIQTWG